jgi:hypothetical protein
VADKQAVLVPDGVNPIDASTLGVAGLTAYQSIVPRVKKGDKYVRCFFCMSYYAQRGVSYLSLLIRMLFLQPIN